MSSSTLPPRTGNDARILIVDDEEPIRRSLQRTLSKEGYECTMAADAAEARHFLDTETFDLMLCDVTMPGESGFSLLAYTETAHPETAVIMVTAVDNPNAAKPAAIHGAYGYIIKPFNMSTILINIGGALSRSAEKYQARSQALQLENDIATRSGELEDALCRLAKEDKALTASQEETVIRLAVAAEWRDPDTGHHLERMSQHAARLATLIGMPAGAVERLRIASQMHDIGKIGLPDAVLLKPGPLTDDERKIMQQHAEIGFKMLKDSESPLLQLGSVIALTHHERYDGSGYPNGLKGDKIPIEGRIVAIADVYDALRSARPYKPAFSLEDSLGILRDSRGSHLDPELLDIFIADIEKNVTE
ncbi:MAG TPA: HD domain-containing phosphohydrolase [Acidimicrobiales bacterium]|nr:HD domain-containing phosphohydrolase [Acidimicrobiales bacterium]